MPRPSTATPAPTRGALAGAVALGLDLLVLLLTAAGLVIVLGGGGRLRLGGLSLGLGHATRPLLLALALAAVRWHRLGGVPWLGRRGPTPRALAARLGPALAAWHGRLAALGAREARLGLLAIVAASLLVKVLLAVTHPGYLTGDDVEILEQSLSRLLGFPYQPWDLRGPLYPLGLIRPVQRLAQLLGVTDPAGLVLAATLAVILLSSLNVVLLYLAARRVAGGRAVPLLAAALLAVAKLPVALAASVLPRTASTTFVLLALLLLAPRRADAGAPNAASAAPDAASTLGAALALALATAIRFSEAIFLLPALAMLARPPRWRAALLLAGGFLAASALLLGAGDLLVWREPFHSLRSIVGYTLLRGESSRGLQPPWHYLEILTSWLGPVTVVFFVAGLRRDRWRLWLWALAPLAALSLLPHKEARYLLPAVPFFALGAALGLADILRHAGSWWAEPPAASPPPPSDRPAGRPRRLAARPAAWLRDRHTGPLWLAALLLLLVPLEADGYRLARSDGAVRLARRVAASARAPVLAERSWRTGGWIHLCRAPRLVFLPAAEGPDTGPTAARLSSELAATPFGDLLLSERLLRRPGIRQALREAGWPVDAPAAPGTTAGGFRWLRRATMPPEG